MYDYDNETLVLNNPLAHAARHHRYWVELFQDFPADGVVKYSDHPNIVVLGHGHDGKRMRLFLVSRDISTNGLDEPTICHFGTRIDPSSVRRGFHAALYRKRWVSPLTRLRWRRALGAT
jgi:hypothetical protein